MRVSHIIAGLAARTGGVASALIELAQGLEGHGVETTILSTDLGETASARMRTPLTPNELPPGTDRLDVRLLPARMPKRLAYSPRLRRAVRTELRRSDLVHVHGLWLYPTYAGGAEAVRAHVPYVVSPQSMLDPVMRSRGRLQKVVTDVVWQRRFLRRAACLQFTAENEARLAFDIAPETPRVVVPNPIDVAAFAHGDGAAFRARYLDGHGGPVVLNHGRITWKKGLDILIAAFATTRKHHRDALLVLAGPDDDGLTPSLRSLAESQGIADRVRFVGMLHGAERAAALAAADVWVLPSRSEGWASAVTEALAAGLPVVLTRGVSSADELDRLGAVSIVELDPVSLAGELNRLLSDPEARAELGHRAAGVAHRFDRSEVAATMLEVYERLVAGSNPVSSSSRSGARLKVGEDA